jgi:hypothetical protein
MKRSKPNEPTDPLLQPHPIFLDPGNSSVDETFQRKETKTLGILQLYVEQLPLSGCGTEGSSTISKLPTLGLGHHISRHQE